MRIFLALLLTATVVACSRPTDEPGQRPVPAEPAEDGAPTAEARPDGTIPVQAFIQYVEAEKPKWSESPLRSALEFLGINRPDAAVTRVSERPGPEGIGPATVTVIRSGLGDDSVQALRYVLRFEAQQDGSWRLVSARWGQRCAPSRGHQRFSPRFCV